MWLSSEKATLSANVFYEASTELFHYPQKLVTLWDHKFPATEPSEPFSHTVCSLLTSIVRFKNLARLVFRYPPQGLSVFHCLSSHSLVNPHNTEVREKNPPDSIIVRLFPMYLRRLSIIAIKTKNLIKTYPFPCYLAKTVSYCLYKRSTVT
jgi:hypothetical protein